MGTTINQLAPLSAVLALAGYCCWSESDDRGAPPTKEHTAKMELTAALLSPASTPTPVRNPFPPPSANNKVLTERSSAKESPVNIVLAKNTSHLVLRAIFTCGDRRLAMINGKFYGEGDSVVAVLREPESNHAGPDNAKPAGQVLAVKIAAPTCHVAKVLADRVVLQCENETTELQFLPSDKKSRSAVSTAHGTQRVKGGK